MVRVGRGRRDRTVAPFLFCDRSFGEQSHLTTSLWRLGHSCPGRQPKRALRASSSSCPQTASWHGLADPFDPIEALRHSAAYLREPRDRFGNLGLAAAAYNAGPGRVSAFIVKDQRRYVAGGRLFRGCAGRRCCHAEWSLMPEKRKQNDDWNRHSKQPKKNSSTHDRLPCLSECRTRALPWRNEPPSTADRPGRSPALISLGEGNALSRHQFQRRRERFEGSCNSRAERMLMTKWTNVRHSQYLVGQWALSSAPLSS